MLLEFKEWLITEKNVKIEKLLSPEQTYGIMSAELRHDPNDQIISPITGQMVGRSIGKSERQQRTQMLIKALNGGLKIPGYSGAKYKFHKASGMWGAAPEKSLVIEKISFNDILALSRFFNQEAFIYSGKNNIPLMYFIRGESAGQAIPALGAKFGNSAALAPKGHRKHPAWTPENPENELGTSAAMGTQADRFPVNFGDTGFHLDFDFNKPLPFTGREIQPDQLQQNYYRKMISGLHSA
jgi:hypothetical protein